MIIFSDIFKIKLMKKEDLRPCWVCGYTDEQEIHGLFHRWHESLHKTGINILYAVVEIEGRVQLYDLNIYNFEFTD